MKLYELLDQECRNAEYEVMKSLGRNSKEIDDILDPIYKKGDDVTRRDPNNALVCTTNYVLPGYISSSM